MIPYLLVYLSLLIPVIRSIGMDVKSRRLIWIAFGVIYVLFIGLRSEVGGDWFAYIIHFNLTGEMSFAEALQFKDPGYHGLNWLVARFGGSVYIVNLLCASAFVFALFSFCSAQSNRWLALSIATPYLVIVVGMGYTRQSVALGFTMLAIIALKERSSLKFLLYIVLAIMFHKTAAILLPVALLATRRDRISGAVAIFLVGVVIYLTFVGEEAEKLVQLYVGRDYEAEGARVRLAMNLVPAVAFLFVRKSVGMDGQEVRFWTVVSLLIVASIFALPFSSVVVDRLNLYFLPLQIVVLVRMATLSTFLEMKRLLEFAIYFGYGIVLYIWLAYANNSQYWVPYSNALIG